MYDAIITCYFFCKMSWLRAKCRRLNIDVQLLCFSVKPSQISAFNTNIFRNVLLRHKGGHIKDIFLFQCTCTTVYNSPQTYSYNPF